MFVAVDGVSVGKKLWASRVDTHFFYSSTMLGQTRAWVTPGTRGGLSF
jgi:hypothetical protein